MLSLLGEVVTLEPELLRMANKVSWELLLLYPEEEVLVGVVKIHL